MIFVTAGTQKFQLNRLFAQIDKLCAEGKIDEEIFAQTGHSDYRPQNYQSTAFLDKNEFDEKMGRSTLVITHGGVGSIIGAMNAARPVIVFPRLCKYKEHVDDHQLEIAEAFFKKNFVLVCRDENDMERLISEARQHVFDRYVSSTSKIIEVVKKAIED